MIQFCSTSAAAGVGGPGNPLTRAALSKSWRSSSFGSSPMTAIGFWRYFSRIGWLYPWLSFTVCGYTEYHSAISAFAASWFLDHFMIPQVSVLTDAKRPLGPAGAFEM